MKDITLTSVGGVIAAIVASLCCIGPVLLVMLGVGSIGAFAAFETYRPYLIGATAVLLALAFYVTYRKREVKCEDGTCKIESVGKWGKIGVWSATLLAVIAIGFPYLGFAPKSSVDTSVEAKAMATLNIEGMDCKACAAGVEGSLASIKGVRKARVEYEKGRALIEYDPRTVKPSAFVERVNQSGFTATLTQQKKGE